MARRLLAMLAGLAYLLALGSAPSDVHVRFAQGAGAAAASIDPSGHYEIRLDQPHWTFGGEIGHAPSHALTRDGEDALGYFQEISFDAAEDDTATARIRTYSARPIVVFSLTYETPNSTAQPFPILTVRPDLPFQLSHQSVPFSPYQLNTLADAADSPWLFFDTAASGYLLSAADNFEIARSTVGQDGSLSLGLDPNLGPLPSGFTQRSILVFGSRISEIYTEWGRVLTILHGKRPAAIDADASLSRLGYWTDNGASYYYNYEPSLGYARTLLAVKDGFARAAIPLGYLQLDSWWYPKGSTGRWDNSQGGIFRYTAAPDLFPTGLQSFQEATGLPLVVHARWIDAASPYRSEYAVSGNVLTDPRYWDDRLGTLARSGVIVYEQDWLGAQAQPLYNLADPEQFLGNMADAAQRAGLNLQYCMPLPRHYLHTVKYGNVTSIRVSEDRFERSKWDAALYNSQLAGALGVWPWVDVFMSEERANLLLATLSGGVVGVGDRLDALNAEDLRKTMRSDGELVKPDAPLVPTDETYVAEAQGPLPPMVASTYTDQGTRTVYAFAYARGTRKPQEVSIVPAQLGIAGRSLVYEPTTQTAIQLDAGEGFMTSVSDTAYFIVVPVGPSGIAFLGDRDLLVPLGRKRINHLMDDGAVRATVEFGAGEGPIALHGYAARAPQVEAVGGTVEAADYRPETGAFSFRLAPSRGQHTVTILLEAPSEDQGASARVGSA
jgi:hypothetical protein